MSAADRHGGALAEMDRRLARGELEDAALLLRRLLIEQGLADWALMIPAAEAVHALRRATEVGRRLELHDLTGNERHCRVCGCTQTAPCEGGCGWAGPDLCTACAPSGDPEPSSWLESVMARSGLGEQLVRAGMQDAYRYVGRVLAQVQLRGSLAEAQATLIALRAQLAELEAGG